MTAPSKHLITTAPRRTKCERCKRVVLDGIADGMAYRADAIPLNPHGELAARIAGRRAYRVLAGRLVQRDQYDIASDTHRGRPAVAAAHTCAPVDPTHIDPAHIAVFLKLTSDPVPEATPEEDQEQRSLFVISGRFAGARVIAVPAEDLECPF
jgi:hypothetical protein